MWRVFLLAALLLSPSLAQAQEIGEGELWLHEDVMEFYRRFDSDHNASFFAVSTNGYDAGYSTEVWYPTPQEMLEAGVIDAVVTQEQLPQP